MSNPSPDSKFPVLVALAFGTVGLILGLVLSSWGGKIAGGAIAACGAIPAAVGMWKGIQQQTQTTLAMAVGALLYALGVAGVMLIWAIIAALR